MSVSLPCCSIEPYLGMDPECTRQAIICLTHSPHTNSNGVLHNILPLSSFRRTLNELKFQMNDKVATLIDQYSGYMDELLKQIGDLKARKIIQLGTLWLRELSQTQEEYNDFKRIFRNDYQGFSCRQIQNFYTKITKTNKLQKQSLEDIPAYSDICKVMDTLVNSPQAGLLIRDKLTNLEGILQKGEIMKRALPLTKRLKQNTKQILLEAKGSVYDIRYNRASLNSSDRSYSSIFTKYPLIRNCNYYLTLKSKYSNIMIGICKQKVKDINQKAKDLHYNQNSLVFNCSNGCTYKQGVFESGSSSLTKGMKEIQLNMQITQTEMILLLGKNVICRSNIAAMGEVPLYLHILMRTKDDFVQIHMDQTRTLESEVMQQQIFKSSELIKHDSQSQLAKYQQGNQFNQLMKMSQYQQKPYQQKPRNRVTFGMSAQQNIQQAPLIESLDLIPDNRGKRQSSGDHSFTLKNEGKGIFQSIERNDKSKVMVYLESSLLGDDSSKEDKNKTSQVIGKRRSQVYSWKIND